jgi:type II secretory pathway component PulM
LDVGTADLPIRDVDLGFCRFLLTHLANPVEVLGRWRKALRAGGVMVLLEVEHLSSSDPVLARYYQIIEGVQAQHGQAMSIGKNLDTMAAKAGWRAVDSRAVDPGLSASSMATLHLPNLETIRKEAWVKSQFSPEELAELAEGLERIGAETGEETSIDSVLRVVIARV